MDLSVMSPYGPNSWISLETNSTLGMLQGWNSSSAYLNFHYVSCSLLTSLGQWCSHCHVSWLRKSIRLKIFLSICDYFWLRYWQQAYGCYWNLFSVWKYFYDSITLGSLCYLELTEKAILIALLLQYSSETGHSEYFRGF